MLGEVQKVHRLEGILQYRMYRNYPYRRVLEQYKAYWDWSVLSGNSELKLNYQQIDRFITYGIGLNSSTAAGARKNYILFDFGAICG